MEVAPKSIERRFDQLSVQAEVDDYYALVPGQASLDALPIAAAVIANLDGVLMVTGENEAFTRLDSTSKRGSLIERSACADRISAVLDGESAGERFEWREGDITEERHYTISIALLAFGPEYPGRVLLTLIDRTLEVQTERSLRSEMLTDSLSGLPNRQGFVEKIEAKFAADGPEHHAVIVVDLARFSRVNDCIGSLGGDELIITVARRLMSTLRGHDQLARTGANEFAMIVRIVDGPDDVLQVARRIEDVLARPCRLSDFEIKVDCSIGCAIADDANNDAERLIRNAQIALKVAKETQRVEFYEPDALVVARRHFLIETELRRALDRDSLTLAFQPLISLATGRVAGFEALARWDHPVMGRIGPDEFIKVAEESGVIVQLGRWAFDRALETLKDWDAIVGAPLPVYVAVNLSAIQIARDDIAPFVESGLRHHGIAGSRLSVELTESAIVADPDRAARTLDALKACNALVAMDDFGTGFSNLASLQRLPIDTLKIDRSFVTGMLGDPDKTSIIRAILSLANALNMSTTAEGIETPDLVNALTDLGCTTGQGYFYAPPMPADAALKFAMESLA